MVNEIVMANNKNNKDGKEDINDAVQNLKENEHQDLAQENLGIEPEEQPKGDPNNPYRLEGFDDKRPEDKNIEKGWTVDSNTSRGRKELGGSDD